MTLPEFGRLLATVDPNVKHHVSAVRGNYTTWAEYERIDASADGLNQGGWKVQVERYTREEYDEIAEALYDLLQNRDDVAVEYLMDSEGDGEDLVIRHLFDCEVW
nr:MAG TPA: hypothetical protein [Caudoviricetes sp.]